MSINKGRARKLSVIYDSMAVGDIWQHDEDALGDWIDMDGNANGPHLHSDLNRYRKKPTKTPIDLGVLIESGIDCEFSDSGGFTSCVINPLHKIHESRYTIKATNITFSYCRPRFNHWHAWRGGKCPLPKGFEVNCQLRGDITASNAAHDSPCWVHTNSPSDIIAFKILKVADDHCMPWEINE